MRSSIVLLTSVFLGIAGIWLVGPGNEMQSAESAAPSASLNEPRKMNQPPFAPTFGGERALASLSAISASDRPIG